MTKKDRSVSDILAELRRVVEGDQEIPSNAVTAEQAAAELDLTKQQAIHLLTKLCKIGEWERAKPYSSRVYVYWPAD